MEPAITSTMLYDDVKREATLSNFLLEAIRHYAPHVINDIEREMKAKYPRARYLSEDDQDG